ncbi:MAG: MerR family DNA-binding protein [Agrobacterium tumefaciens]
MDVSGPVSSFPVAETHRETGPVSLRTHRCAWCATRRRFGKKELERLAFIRHARDLGITIESIRELIDLAAMPRSPARMPTGSRRSSSQSVRERIAQLRRLEKELERIATCCTGDTVGDCNVIPALADHALCDSEHLKPMPLVMNGSAGRRRSSARTMIQRAN